MVSTLAPAIAATQAEVSVAVANVAGPSLPIYPILTHRFTQNFAPSFPSRTPMCQKVDVKLPKRGPDSTTWFVFGTAGMLILPHVANHLLGHCSEAAGMFLGIAIHDTAQVMGAGLT